VDDVVGPPPAPGERRGRCVQGPGLTEEDGPHVAPVVGDAEGRHQGSFTAEVPEESGAESGVDGAEEKKEHGKGRVDEPVGHGPIAGTEPAGSGPAGSGPAGTGPNGTEPA
jgi:hypothetical protein